MDCPEFCFKKVIKSNLLGRLPIVRCIDAPINHNDLEVLLGRILANPVEAQDTESLDTTTDSLLSDGLQVQTGFNSVTAPKVLGLPYLTCLPMIQCNDDEHGSTMGAGGGADQSWWTSSAK